MEHLGIELKKAREASGLSLREMATRTKIAVSSLEALERNDFSRLPGGIFGRSFVRAYALEVGVDPDVTVSRFVELLEQSEREAAERRAAMRPEITLDDQQFLNRQRRALLLLQIGIVLFVVAVVGLVVWRVRVAWPTASGPEAGAAIQAPPSVGVAALPSTAPGATSTADPAVTGAAAPAAAAEPMVIEVETTGDTWITVSLDNRSQVPRLFRSGDHQRFEVDQEVLLDVPNAGMVRVTIDGKAAKPLGAAGAHVRTRITRQNAAEFIQ